MKLTTDKKIIDYISYELLIDELPPAKAPSYKSYKSDELEKALKDFEFMKEFDSYISIYLMKITVKGQLTTRERIKEYHVEKWAHLNDN